MEIPLFLAMTAAEFQNADTLPAHTAWMACHFSLYGTGISNIPGALPPGSMLILNDRIPIFGHDPQVVAKTLCETAASLKCDCILLDFQRQACDELTNVVQTILKQALCPVAITPLYAENFDCPVLVPPIPPHLSPEEVLSVWKGRELWLELSTEGTEITVTEAGSHHTSLSHCIPEANAHAETELLCHYCITVDDDRIRFQLGRTKEDQAALLRAGQACGATRAVSLWQEMGEKNQSLPEQQALD
jgi:hypothetical protein